MAEVITQQVCKTKYVYLEMILNKETKYDVISGLFKGIVEKSGDKFILLHGLKDATNVLNLKFFNIMTIEELEEDYKNMTYLTAEKVDQETALGMVELMYANLLKAGHGVVNDEEVIDIAKYEDVPEEYLKGKPIDKGAAASGTAAGVGSFASPSTSYKGTGSAYTKAPAVKKDPEPTSFGRSKGKKPNKKAIELMTEKLDQIKAGDYEYELPETLGEDDAGEEDTEDDYVYGYNHHMGM